MVILSCRIKVSLVAGAYLLEKLTKKTPDPIRSEKRGAGKFSSASFLQLREKCREICQLELLLRFGRFYLSVLDTTPNQTHLGACTLLGFCAASSARDATVSCDNSIFKTSRDGLLSNICKFPEGFRPYDKCQIDSFGIESGKSTLQLLI